MAATIIMVRTVATGLIAGLAAAHTLPASGAPASPAPVIAPVTAPTALVDAAGRAAQSLDGQWHHIADPMAMGLRPGRMRNFARNFRPQNQELVEFDWPSSPTLTIPGDWTSQVPGLGWYEGWMWHYRRFNAAPAPGRRQFVQFGAVNYHASVHINGTQVGEHRGGFTPFAMEITDQLRGGDNFIVVGANNRHDAASVPAEKVDWWNYGGITRAVQIISVPTTFLRRHHVQLTRAGAMQVRAGFDGPDAAGRVLTVSIPALGWTRRITANADGSIVATLPAPPGLKRWSPGAPVLYDVMLSHGSGGGAERLSDRIGFRTIDVRGTQILLNGQPIFLRGISLHEEAIGPVATRTVTPAAARALLSEAQALGANFVRLAHYPHDATTVQLADEMGLLVWSEIPIYWDMDFDGPATLMLAREMLAEMIDRDANRASVVIWSVGNETPETPARLAFMRRLIDDVRARDPDRLVSAALHDDADDSSGADGRVTVDDPIGAYLDVLAMNRYEAWYGMRSPPQIDEVNWTVAYDKPLIFSEFGADALYGYRAGPLERWSEEYQALLYDRTFAMADRIPGLAGTSPWILKDFRSPRRFHGQFQNYWNRKGLIDPEGRRKLAWQVVRDRYAAQAAAGQRVAP